MQINKFEQEEDMFNTFYLVKFSKAELLALRDIATNYINYTGFVNLKTVAKDFTENIPEDLHESTCYSDYVGKVFK